MMFVIPMTIALAAAPDQKEAAFDRLAALLEQPLVRTLLRERGIPLTRLQRDRAYPHEQCFAAPFWFFLDCANAPAAKEARDRASKLLGEPELVTIARMNRVSLASINVGEPSPYPGA